MIQALRTLPVFAKETLGNGCLKILTNGSVILVRYSRAYVLLGYAGVGKSVLAGALAQRKRDSEHLAAVFFCRHKDRRRNHPLSLLATLARDLCKCSSIVGGEEGVRKLITNSEFNLEVHELFAK